GNGGCQSVETEKNHHTHRIRIFGRMRVERMDSVRTRSERIVQISTKRIVSQKYFISKSLKSV
ncbi:MAG: hypothetical protein K2L13_02300, partial [Opitutales bacterium]|nr:hypothetical protein [Opitutales bacterium]